MSTPNFKKSPYLATGILLAARLTITRHWRETEAPKLSEVITTIHSIYSFEKLMAHRSDSLKSFEAAWQDLSSWYSIHYTTYCENLMCIDDVLNTYINVLYMCAVC